MSNKIYGKCGYISLNACTIMQTNTCILEYFHKQMNILDDAMGNLFFLISSLVAFERCNTHTYIAMYVYEFICMYICLYVWVCICVKYGGTCIWACVAVSCGPQRDFCLSKVDNFDKNEFIVWTAVLTAETSMWALPRAKHLSRSSSSSWWLLIYFCNSWLNYWSYFVADSVVF